MNILKFRATHSQRLERWLGPESVEHLSASMRGWYGRPIAIAAVPGAVWVGKDGDFVGPIRGGGFGSLADYAYRRARRAARRQLSTANTGFASLADLLSEANLKRQVFLVDKAGTGNTVAGASASWWGLGNNPAAGANASNAPGGDAPTNATTGALPLVNPRVSGDTTHYAGALMRAGLGTNAVGMSILLYDRIFQVNKTMNSTATEAVTGVPTRYQSTTQGAEDSAENNFLFVEVGGTVLANTAHNWTTCLYTDQSGNTGVTLPSVTGIAACHVRRLDMPVGQWFAPLASGDTGIRALTQMQCSAAVGTGVINFVMGHPIAWIPCVVGNIVCLGESINSAFNLVRIFDSAALGLLEVNRAASSGTGISGSIDVVQG